MKSPRWSCICWPARPMTSPTSITPCPQDALSGCPADGSQRTLSIAAPDPFRARRSPAARQDLRKLPRRVGSGGPAAGTTAAALAPLPHHLCAKREVLHTGDRPCLTSSWRNSPVAPGFTTFDGYCMEISSSANRHIFKEISFASTSCAPLRTPPPWRRPSLQREEHPGRRPPFRCSGCSHV
jgi:hypothetical protein